MGLGAPLLFSVSFVQLGEADCWVVALGCCQQSFLLHRGAGVGSCVTHDADQPGLAVEFCGSNRNFCLGGGEGHGLVTEVEIRGQIASDLTLQRRDNLNFRVGFGDGDLVFEGHRAVTLNSQLLLHHLSKFAAHTHVQRGWELVAQLAVDYGEGVDRNQNLIPFTVNSHGVVVVLIGLVACGRELNVDVLRHSGGEHSFLVVPDFEIRGLRRQHVQALRGRGIVDQSQLERVGLVDFETRKLDDGRTCLENAVTANGVVDVRGDGVAPAGLGLSQDVALHLNDCFGLADGLLVDLHLGRLGLGPRLRHLRVRAGGLRVACKLFDFSHFA